MGKKKQRKGALDLDDDEFPEPTEEVIEAGADVTPVAPASKKQNKGKKGKKVCLRQLQVRAMVQCKAEYREVACSSYTSFIR